MAIESLNHLVWSYLRFEDNVKSIILWGINHLNSLLTKILLKNQSRLRNASTTKIAFWSNFIYLLIVFRKEKWFWNFIIVICLDKLAIFIEVNFIFILLRKSCLINVSTSSSYQNSPLLRIKYLSRVNFFINCIIWFFFLYT